MSFAPMPVWTCRGCCWLLQLATSCVSEETRPMKLYMFVFQGGGEFNATFQRRPCFCFSLFMLFVYCMCSVPLYGVIRMNFDLSVGKCLGYSLVPSLHSQLFFACCKKSGREPGQIHHMKCVIPGILVERSDGNKSGGRECKEGQKKLLSVRRHRSVPGRPQPTFFSVSCGSVCDANLDVRL